MRDLPDERNMGAHRPMLGSALIAQEDADVGATPLRVLALAVEADLSQHQVSILGAFRLTLFSGSCRRRSMTASRKSFSTNSFMAASKNLIYRRPSFS